MPIRMQRFRKEFLERKLRTMIEEKALVAVAYVGNMNHSDKTMVRQELAKAEATISFTKSTLQRMALDSMGHASLVPLLRGETSIIAGPAEVSTAIALQAISKQLPDFTVLGASLHQRRLLQFNDISRLATLPPAEVVHTNMLMQMAPGASLQVPNVGAYLVAVLQMHTDALGAAQGATADDA